jgi:hypothetical protein
MLIEQRLNLGAELGIVGTHLHQECSALLRRLRQRGLIQPLDFQPAWAPLAIWPFQDTPVIWKSYHALAPTGGQLSKGTTIIKISCLDQDSQGGG